MRPPVGRPGVRITRSHTADTANTKGQRETRIERSRVRSEQVTHRPEMEVTQNQWGREE